MYDAARGEKAEMQGLNDRLARHLQNIGTLKGDGGVDPAQYRQAMQALENELGQLKQMYEAELGKLRYSKIGTGGCAVYWE